MQIMLSSQSDIITCAQEVEMMIKQLEAQLEQLKLTVKSKTCYPDITSLCALIISFETYLRVRALKSHKIRWKVILIVFYYENILVLYKLILFFLLIL